MIAVGELREVAVEPDDQLLRFELLGAARVAAHVDEEHADGHAPGPRPTSFQELVAVPPDLLGDLRVDVLREQAHQLGVLGALADP